MLQTLLKQKVDVNAPQPDGSTALHWAAQTDDLETADLLIGAGAQVGTANDYGITPLLLACQNGSAVMVEKLLKAGAKPNGAFPTGETALMIAARTGKPGAVQALLVQGADVNAKEPSLGQTALMWAAAQGHWRSCSSWWTVERTSVQSRTPGASGNRASSTRAVSRPCCLRLGTATSSPAGSWWLPERT